MDFWARRRAAVQAEAEADTHALAAAESAERAEALAEKDDTEILAELGLPDPQTLESGDDFAAFLNNDVPEHLRRVALRRLWRSNPVLACVDGLNEYDDDYRAAMLLQGPIKTAYQVGKGMLKHVEEMARQAEQAEKDADAFEGESIETACAEPDEPISTEPVDAIEAQQSATLMDVEPIADDAEDVPVSARRMRFRFEEVSA
ncbi:MAG: DUF3306 domain-containing protein [Roseobacter sp.]